MSVQLKIPGFQQRRTVYEMIYSRLQQMGIIDENGIMQAGYMKFESRGLMPLSVDNLYIEKGNQVISIAHNGKQNGDVMADPDMQIKIIPEMKMAEALTFQNDYMGIFQEVYPEPGKFYPKLKKELNAFLNSWLRRMIEDQKYVLVSTEEQ
jgi:uncharacterized protein YqiB (DUF1249 family)